jgi:hypothetical protein
MLESVSHWNLSWPKLILTHKYISAVKNPTVHNKSLFCYLTLLSTMLLLPSAHPLVQLLSLQINYCNGWIKTLRKWSWWCSNFQPMIGMSFSDLITWTHWVFVMHWNVACKIFHKWSWRQGVLRSKVLETKFVWQWDWAMCVATCSLSYVCGIAAIVHPLNKNYKGLSGKYEKTRNSCLLSVENLHGSRHLVFWSLETLTGLRDRVQRLVA